MTSTSDHSSTSRGSDARTSHSHDVDPDRGGSNTGGSRSNDGHRRSRNNSRARRERRRRRATYSAQHGNKQQRAKEDSGNDTPNRSSGADSSGTQTGRKKNRRRARRRSDRPRDAQRRTAQPTARAQGPAPGAAAGTVGFFDAAEPSDTIVGHAAIVRNPCACNSRSAPHSPRIGGRRRHHEPGQGQIQRRKYPRALAAGAHSVHRGRADGGSRTTHN